MPVNLMMAIGKAALNHAGFSLIGDAAEIAKAAWEDWRRSPEERLDELEAYVKADDEEVARAADHVAGELAAGEPEPVRMKLATFLKQVPSRIRQSQRRPADPTGRTIRPGMVVGRPEDLIPFVPDRLPQFKPGDRPLAGVDWVLVELLGIGGFGEVWKARNAHFDGFDPVALKFCTDPLTRDRLLRYQAKVDVRVMRVRRHPGIVRLEATYLNADPPCLQFEYVEGGDLASLILDWHRQTEPPSPEYVAQEFLRLAEIVAFVHGIDPPIVHRDLKPANILVQRSADGPIAFKITDFGIGGIARANRVSRGHTDPRQALTMDVRGSGTVPYASQEQLQGHNPDPRDDVHALGVIWFQMLTGDLTKGRPSAAWRRRFRNRGMPEAMLELLGSCFEEQDDRPADAAVLAERLGELLKPPSEPPTDVVNSIGMKLKLIPPGEFQMGAPESDKDADDREKPQHRVHITQPFYLGIHPVTRGQFRRFVEATSYRTEAETDGKGGYACYEVTGVTPEWVQYPWFTWRYPGFDQTDDHPVVSVSWNDTKAFCDWLSQQEGQTYRLPTEAEWEYACRAGTTTRYSFGDNEAALDQYAWHFSNSYWQTHPVGEKTQNGFGLHDMHGNVWEWCWDGYTADYYKQSPANDPRGPDQAADQVVRGGNWHDDPWHARSSCRGRCTPEYRSYHLGFRVARVQSGR
jgi:formylglycine-generating enzyme required for sulfatase activity